MEKLTATSKIRITMLEILQQKENINGLSFNELWNELEKDKELKKKMYNEKGKKRLGLLQGISNRIKDNKEPNVRIISHVIKGNLFIYHNNDLEYLANLTKNYIEQVQNLDLTEFTKQATAKEGSAFVNLENSLNELGDVNQILLELNKKILAKKAKVKSESGVTR